MANNTAQGKTLEKKGFKLPISGNALVLLIALVLVTAISSALNPNYFTYGNFINILVSSTLIGLTAIGMTFLIMTGGSDLSAGSVAAFGGRGGRWSNLRPKTSSAMRFFSISIEPPAIIQPRVLFRQYSTIASLE